MPAGTAPPAVWPFAVWPSVARGRRRRLTAAAGTRKAPMRCASGPSAVRCQSVVLNRRYCALEGTRTPNLLIRSQMLYPLSYERMAAEAAVEDSTTGAARSANRAGVDAAVGVSPGSTGGQTRGELLAEHLGQEHLERLPRAAVGPGLVLRAVVGCVRLRHREGVHRPGVRHDLPVEVRDGAHLVLPRLDRVVGHHRVDGTGQHEQLRPDRRRVGRVVRDQPAVEGHRTDQVGAGAGQFQCRGAAEAVAHDDDPGVVDVGVGAEPVESRLHPGTHERQVLVVRAGDLAGGVVARSDALAVDVGTERHVAQAREHRHAGLDVLVHAVPVVDDEHTGAGTRHGGVLGEDPEERGALVVVTDGLDTDVGSGGLGDGLQDVVDRGHVPDATPAAPAAAGDDGPAAPQVLSSRCCPSRRAPRTRRRSRPGRPCRPSTRSGTARRPSSPARRCPRGRRAWRRPRAPRRGPRRRR